jgi:hypothetical protein
MVRAIVIEPSGKTAVQQLDGFDKIKNAIGGGFVEVVLFGNDALAWCDEEGKLKGFPVNRLVTKLAYERNIGLIPGDVFNGTIVITGSYNDECDETDAPENLIKQLVDQLYP